MKTLNPFKSKIAEISDERGNGGGVWVYLKKEWADFGFDPFNPTRQIHEQTIGEIVNRMKSVRIINETDYAKYPHLK